MTDITTIPINKADGSTSDLSSHNGEVMLIVPALAVAVPASVIPVAATSRTMAVPALIDAAWLIVMSGFVALESLRSTSPLLVVTF